MKNLKPRYAEYYTLQWLQIIWILIVVNIREILWSELEENDTGRFQKPHDVTIEKENVDIRVWLEFWAELFDLEKLRTIRLRKNMNRCGMTNTSFKRYFLHIFHRLISKWTVNHICIYFLIKYDRKYMWKVILFHSKLCRHQYVVFRLTRTSWNGKHDRTSLSCSKANTTWTCRNRCSPPQHNNSLKATQILKSPTETVRSTT